MWRNWHTARPVNNVSSDDETYESPVEDENSLPNRQQRVDNRNAVRQAQQEAEAQAAAAVMAEEPSLAIGPLHGQKM